MQGKKNYQNGQAIYEDKGQTRTYYYKDGGLRARGKFAANQMEGKWIFHRDDGQLWVVGNFKANKKHGLWVRYDRKGKEEYREEFANNKVVKKTKTKAATKKKAAPKSKKAKALASPKTSNR